MEAVKIEQLAIDPAKSRNGNGNGLHAVGSDDIETDDQFINGIRSNGYSGRGGQQNAGRGNFRGRSMSRGRGGPPANRGSQRGVSAGPSHSDRSNQQTGQQTGPGQNQSFSFDKLKCKYCKKDGHTQAKCYARIRDNAPCTGRNGATYWPSAAQQAPIKEEDDDVQGAISSGPSSFMPSSLFQ